MIEGSYSFSYIINFLLSEGLDSIRNGSSSSSSSLSDPASNSSGQVDLKIFSVSIDFRLIEEAIIIEERH